MHIFLPESIYNIVKDDQKFKNEYTKLLKKFDAGLNCLVDYNNMKADITQYNQLHSAMNNVISEKHRKIWECFCVNINYNEKTEKELWKQSKKIIDECKSDSDLDVKMYGYYMELANTADHESGEWFTNIQESLEIFDNTKDYLYDPRIYTKYYWDLHENLVFNMKFGSDKYTDITELYNKYLKIDEEAKNFLWKKYDSKYFRDIINHKTLYTGTIFWGGINHRTLNTPEKSTEILKNLDRYLSSLEHKYKPFNMHLMEWLWINLKWWQDRNRLDFVGIIFYDYILPMIEDALKDKTRMLKSFLHHNFNYTSNFLVFVSSLNMFEKLILQTNSLENLTWTNKERKIIFENNFGETKDWWGERKPTLVNYQKKFLPIIPEARK